MFFCVLACVTVLHAQTFQGDTLWARDYSSSGAFSCAFSPSGDRLAVSYECMGPMVRVLDVATGDVLWESSTPDLCLYQVKFSSDGKYIALAEELGHLMVYDMEIMDTIHYFDTQTGGLNTVDFSPDGSVIYAGGNDGSIRIYNTLTGQPVHSILGHMDAVLSIDVSHDGRYLATGGADMMINVFDLENNYQSIFDVMNDSIGMINTVKFTPDHSRLIAGSSNDNVYVYNMSSLECDTVLHFHSADVNTIDISHDGTFAVSGANDQKAVMFSLWNYEQVTYFTNMLQTRVNGVAISPDQTKLAVVNHIGYSIMYEIGPFVGLDETNSFAQLSVYPNPTTSWLYFPCKVNSPYQITDVQGRSVLQGYTSGAVQVDLLPAGIYVIYCEGRYSRFIRN